MVELLRSNDLVFLSWVRAILAAETIDAVILDEHTSVIEGNIAAIPRRIMVHVDDLARAQELMSQAEDSIRDG